MCIYNFKNNSVKNAQNSVLILVPCTPRGFMHPSLGTAGIKYVESTVNPNTIKDIYLSIFVDYICKRLNFKLVDV